MSSLDSFLNVWKDGWSWCYSETKPLDNGYFVYTMGFITLFHVYTPDSLDAIRRRESKQKK